MTPLKFSVRTDLFRIVARFAARERFVLDVNPALAGVRFERAPGAGVMLSASNGLIALFVHDVSGALSRPATMQRPDAGLELVRDAARGRAGFHDNGAPARLVFQEGHCLIDADPPRELMLSEIGGPYPDFRPRMPAHAVRAPWDAPSDAVEMLAVTARQLASAAGLEPDEAAASRIAAYREPRDGGFTVIRFSAFARAFALVAPDGAEPAFLPAAFEPPPWVPALESAA